MLVCSIFKCTLERFFSQMIVVKMDWHNRLAEENLTALLYVKVEGPSRQDFHSNHCSGVVDLWSNKKSRRFKQYNPALLHIHLRLASQEVSKCMKIILSKKGKIMVHKNCEVYLKFVIGYGVFYVIVLKKKNTYFHHWT